MTIDIEALKALSRTGKVHTDDGDRIGTVGDIYLDELTGEPSWVTVRTGLFGLRESLVPVAGCRLEEDHLVVAYDKSTVKDAPQLEPDATLSAGEEDQLYEYYGLSGRADGEGADGHSGDEGEGPAHEGAGSGEGDGTGPADHTARARLRRYVVTERIIADGREERAEVTIEEAT